MMDNFSKAVDLVVRNQRASTSYISRNLGIPYVEAVGIMLELESTEVVTSPNYVGKREVLLKPEDLD